MKMEEKNKVLVKIKDREIKNGDLDRIIEKYPVEKRIYFETENGRKQLLEQKIAFTLFGLYAEECGKDREEEFLVHINDIKEQILTQTIMQELFAGLAVTDEEAKEFYRKNPDKFVLEETVDARHILVDEKEEAEMICKKLKDGEMSFADAAAAYSKCPSKEKGGDLGYFKRGMMVKEFEDAAFLLPLHVCSEPVKSQFGYHIIEVTDRTEKGMLPLEEVQEKIKEQLLSVKRQEIYEKKLAELKEKYQVRE